MTDHLHREFVTGCFRCEIGRDEVDAIRRDMRIEATALRDMADDFRDIDMATAADLCIKKAEQLERDAEWPPRRPSQRKA